MTAGTSGAVPSQGSSANVVADNPLSRQEARLRAAAAAASIYEKSFVYPSANRFTWYSRLLIYFLVLHT